jgi:hypothetical protein
VQRLGKSDIAPVKQRRENINLSATGDPDGYLGDKRFKARRGLTQLLKRKSQSSTPSCLLSEIDLSRTTSPQHLFLTPHQ